MSKAPEEMAEEYASSITRESERFIRSDVEYAFFAGYKAAAPQLISVKDRLPECGENYLVLFRVRGDKHSPVQFEITWFDNTWDFPSTFEVTHWMPLPNLPKNPDSWNSSNNSKS